MFSMSYTDSVCGCDTAVEMKIDESDEMTLTQMFANFMVMMHKIGYSEKSWDNVLNDMVEWRNECGDAWASEFMYENRH
jgi:hypothetical protein